MAGSEFGDGPSSPDPSVDGPDGGGTPPPGDSPAAPPAPKYQWSAPTTPPTPLVSVWDEGWWGHTPWHQPALPPPPRRSRALTVVALGAAAALVGGIATAVGVTLNGRGSSSPATGSALSAPSSSAPQSSGATPGAGGSNPTAPDVLPTPGTAAPGGTLSLAEITARDEPSIVDVTTTLADGSGSAAGTGVILTSNGDVLTNNHVVRGASTIKVLVNGKGQEYTATVLGTDVTDDVALIKMRNVSGLPAMPVGDSSGLDVGDAVVAIGNALGRQGPLSVTQGAITALDQTITASDGAGTSETLNGLIQMNAPIQPGDSGGPLVDSSGRMIGMDTAASVGFRRRTASNTAFAIPVNTALTIAHQIQTGQSNGTVQTGPRPLLGVSISDAAGQSPVSGAFVDNVGSGTPADSAGIVAGDVITSLDGTAVSDAATLRSAITRHHPGDSVKVVWVDQAGLQHQATVILSSGPPL